MNNNIFYPDYTIKIQDPLVDMLKTFQLIFSSVLEHQESRRNSLQLSDLKTNELICIDFRSFPEYK